MEKGANGVEKVTSPPRLRCQRIGCDATFTDEDNPDGSCRYHESPLFHDGMKEWSCCKKRSHDFSLFLEIPGCKTGKHTTEKPVIKTTPSAPKPTLSATSNKQTKGSCLRCRQGFFCSDHGSQGNSSRVVPAATINQPKDSPKPEKKKVGLNEPQTCRNKGCGKTFKEKDNHETACGYHPGPPVFHDRIKGWKCCDVHVKEFDEFMNIPPCTKGWHNGDTE